MHREAVAACTSALLLAHFVLFLSRPLAAAATADALRSPYAWVRLCGGQGLVLLPLLFRMRWHLLAPLHCAMVALCATRLRRTAAAVHLAVPELNAEAFIATGAAILVLAGLPLPLLACRYVKHVERQRFLASVFCGKRGGWPNRARREATPASSEPRAKRPGCLAVCGGSLGERAPVTGKAASLCAASDVVAVGRGLHPFVAATAEIKGTAALAPPQQMVQLTAFTPAWRAASGSVSTAASGASEILEAMPLPGLYPAVQVDGLASEAPGADAAADSVDALVQQWEAALLQPVAAPAFAQLDASVLAADSAVGPQSAAARTEVQKRNSARQYTRAGEAAQHCGDEWQDDLSLSLDELMASADELVDQMVDDMMASKPARQLARDMPFVSSSQRTIVLMPLPAASADASLPARPAELYAASSFGAAPAKACHHPAARLPARAFSQQFEATVDALVDEELDSLLAEESADGVAVQPRRWQPQVGKPVGPLRSGCVSAVRAPSHRP